MSGRLVFACALAGLLWVIGCAQPPCALEPCDIRKQSCQEAVLEVTHCLRGTEGGRSVPVRVLDADEYIDEQAAAADAGVDDGGDDEADQAYEAYLRGLSLLDLGQVTESGGATRARLASVAAFYSSEDGKITILDRGDPLDGFGSGMLLVHEMVHALQDQEHGLDALYEPAQTTDHAIAIGALIEGEATLYSDFAAAHAYGFSSAELELERAFASYRRQSQERLAQDEDPILRLYPHFAYAFGGAYLHRAWREGRHARIAELLRDPPRTQRELMYGPGDERVAGVAWYETDLAERAIPMLDAALTHATSRQLGAFGVLALYQRAARDPGYPPSSPSPNDALDAVRDVETDVLSVLFDDERTVITWRIRLESEASARELRSRLTAEHYSRDDEDRNLRRRVIDDGRDVIVAAARPRDALPTDLEQLEWDRPPEEEGETANEPAILERRIECVLALP